MGQKIAAVFLVLGLLAAFLAVLRRKNQGIWKMPFRTAAAKTRRVEVLERVPLTAHHSLHLVRIEDRVLLIGVSPSGCNRIAFGAPQRCPSLGESG